MKLKSKLAAIRKSIERGFTLIELVIVVAVLGVLAIIVVNVFGIGVTTGSKAQAIYDTCGKFAQSWGALAQAAGTSTQISGSTLPDTASGKNALDVLIGGKTNVTATYQNAYDQAALKPLTNAAQGSAGAYTVSGYAVTLGGGGTNALSCAYATVPDEITKLLVTKYGSNVATLAASDATNSVIQYSAAAADGTRTVTVFVRM